MTTATLTPLSPHFALAGELLQTFLALGADPSGVYVTKWEIRVTGGITSAHVADVLACFTMAGEDLDVTVEHKRSVYDDRYVTEWDQTSTKLRGVPVHFSTDFVHSTLEPQA